MTTTSIPNAFNQYSDSQTTLRTTDMASKKHPKYVNAIESATRSQKLCTALQKLGNDECLIPVLFKLVTPDAADPALIIANAKTCMKSINNISQHIHESKSLTFLNRLVSNYLITSKKNPCMVPRRYNATPF